MSFLTEIESLEAALSPYIRNTPTIYSPYLSAELDAEVYLKLELLQHTGAFKVRGAISKMLTLNEGERAQGVVAFSAGNHGLGVAYAAKLFQTKAKVLVPQTISELKKNALLFWGAEVIVGGTDPIALKELACETAAREGKVLFHPFDDEAVIRGQATLGVEMLNSVPDADAMIISIGGGGLISGIARYTKEMRPELNIYGVETLGSESMKASLDAGQIVTLEKITSIADSLGARSVSLRTFETVQKYVSDVVTVSDEEAIAALEKIITFEKVFCEPAASCTLSAASGPLREKIRGKKVILLLCGGNFSLSQWKSFKGLL